MWFRKYSAYIECLIVGCRKFWSRSKFPLTTCQNRKFKNCFACVKKMCMDKNYHKNGAVPYDIIISLTPLCDQKNAHIMWQKNHLKGAIKRC